MKKIIFTLILLILIPIKVNAGSVSWESSKSYNNTYDIIIRANDTSSNYFSGSLNITNGNIINVSTSNGFINKNENSNNLYFARDGILKGNYIIATIRVKMTGYSTFTINNPSYGINKCTHDKYNNLYNENGNIVDQNTYNNSYCNKSNDATLKSLSVNKYTLNKKFDKDITSYNVYVPSNEENVTFNAIPTNNKATITNGLSCNLNKNINICRIEVKAENGKLKTYYINVYKKNNSSNDITNFKVRNGVLNKPFNINTNYYEVNTDSNVKFIYFDFDTPFNHYSQKCSSDADTCSFNVEVNNNKYSYTFKFINNQNNNVIANNIGTTNNKNINKSSSKKNNTKKENITENKNNSNVDSQNYEQQIEEANETEDKTINPIDNSKKRKKKEDAKQETNKEEKEDNSNDNIFKKNTFFILLAGVNLTLGIIIGRFIKKR